MGLDSRMGIWYGRRFGICMLGGEYWGSVFGSVERMVGIVLSCYGGGIIDCIADVLRDFREFFFLEILRVL